MNTTRTEALSEITTRAQYVELVGSEADAIEQENAALSIGREFLPPLVQAVVDGQSPEPFYWNWLAKQFVADDGESFRPKDMNP